MPHKALLALRRVAAKAGVSIDRISRAPSWEYTFHQLEKSGLRPRTVFDIGVARGTPWLYAAFPDATFHLIDPTRESLPFMERIAKRYKAHVHNIALADRNTEMEIVVRGDIGCSALFEEVGEADVITRYMVPVRTFGQITQEFERPALVKIDVQGAEMLLLQGLVDRLAEIDAIIIEVSTIATVHGGPEMAEVIGFFAKQDWSVADILSLGRRPLDGALAQVDLLFVPNDSPMRRDKRWAAGAHAAAPALASG
jgi:FkbM family methyltransferase